MHSNIIGNRTVEVKSISIPATHMSQNFWCHFCEAWIMHFCLWDHKRREDRCKCIKASTRLKWWRFSSATARLLIQQGWCWKQVTVGTKSSERRCKVEVTVHHRLLSICMRSCRRGGGGLSLTGADSEAEMTDCLSCLCLRLTVGVQRDDKCLI